MNSCKGSVNEVAFAIARYEGLPHHLGSDINPAFFVLVRHFQPVWNGVVTCPLQQQVDFLAILTVMVVVQLPLRET